jgi:hypothetical protein
VLKRLRKVPAGNKRLVGRLKLAAFSFISAHSCVYCVPVLKMLFLKSHIIPSFTAGVFTGTTSITITTTTTIR